ncbi:MAG: hypothetical protein DME54_09040 [Verrucomicrobia bacterium]|nr:MAG: hypothetical protein DME54_09040 [Verrucomicrobiota bacterium]
MGRTRVSRAGFGVAPKQSFLWFRSAAKMSERKESSRSRGRARQHARRVRYPILRGLAANAILLHFCGSK